MPAFDAAIGRALVNLVQRLPQIETEKTRGGVVMVTVGLVSFAMTSIGIGETVYFTGMRCPLRYGVLSHDLLAEGRSPSKAPATHS